MAPKADGGQRLGLAAFGLGLLTDVAPPGAWEARPLSEPILRLRSATSRAIAESWSGLDEIGWEGTIDGAPFVVERGRAGDNRFVHTGRSVHHLSADATVLLCGPDTNGEPTRWRVILDSVLFSVALLAGYEALHAGAFATPAGAVAIAAGTGGGKSTLLAEMLRGGCPMLADDVIVLESRPDAPPIAHPGAPLMTVPANVDPAPGPLIASVEQERWVAVPAHPQAIPLAGLVVLNRRPGLATALHRAGRPLAALMGSLLRFPRTRERERARFELAGAIAAHIPIWELDADPSVDPRTLAGLLLTELVGPHRTRTRTRNLSAVV